MFVMIMTLIMTGVQLLLMMMLIYRSADVGRGVYDDDEGGGCAVDREWW